MSVASLRVRPGRAVHLRRYDPDSTRAFDGVKEEAEGATERLRAQLDALQETFYADRRHALLIILQGMDTAGKDGVIRHVFEGVNPQGVHVAAFKVPTPEEADHDFLWRIHPHAPARGHITIFNRSHYEDVLAARVHGSVPPKVWEHRFGAINGFEKALVHEGTLVVKFFLHIDAQEQRGRLQARFDDPTKRWKLSPSDLQERKLWGRYQAAYEQMIYRTATDWAPWYIVPSNKKWFRNWAVSRVLVDTLQSLRPRYPKGDPDLARRRVV